MSLCLLVSWSAHVQIDKTWAMQSQWDSLYLIVELGESPGKQRRSLQEKEEVKHN